MLIVDDACGIGACCFFLNNDAILATAATPAIIGNNAPPVAAVPAANAAVPPVAAVPVATAPAAAFPPPIFNKLPTALNIPPASFFPTPFSLNDNKFVTCFAASLAIIDNKVFNNALPKLSNDNLPFINMLSKNVLKLLSIWGNKLSFTYICQSVNPCFNGFERFWAITGPADAIPSPIPNAALIPISFPLTSISVGSIANNWVCNRLIMLLSAVNPMLIKSLIAFFKATTLCSLPWPNVIEKSDAICLKSMLNAFNISDWVFRFFVKSSGFTASITISAPKFLIKSEVTLSINSISFTVDFISFFNLLTSEILWFAALVIWVDSNDAAKPGNAWPFTFVLASNISASFSAFFKETVSSNCLLTNFCLLAAPASAKPFAKIAFVNFS